MSPSIAREERLRRTERVISFVRFAVVSFNVVTYLFLAPDSDRRGLASVIAVLAMLYAIITVAYQPTKEQSFAIALTNTILDNLFIGLWVYATDGINSPYYPLFYAEAAASIGRFGVLIGNLTGVGGAIIYLIVVGLDGLGGHGYRVTTRIGYIFLIGAFVSYVVDSARRSEREAAIAEGQTAAYKEMDRLRATFVTNISHELRTPLTAIRGAASTLARKPSLSESEQETLVDMIDRQSGHLSSLVQDIIDIGLVDQGRLVPRMTYVDVKRLVDQEAASFDHVDRDLVKVLPDEEVVAYCDPKKIGNALTKVLDNAVKFSPTGSKITVSVEHDDDEVWIAVKDEGIGISQEKIPAIFDRFHQLDSSHTRAAGGTGIGLSIAKTMMDIHRGTIEVTSTHDRGSTFALRFPKRGSVTETAASTDSQPVGNVGISTEPHPG